MQYMRYLWHKVYNKIFCFSSYVCTQRLCRLPRTILSRSRPDPRNNLFVLVVDTTGGDLTVLFFFDELFIID